MALKEDQWHHTTNSQGSFEKEKTSWALEKEDREGMSVGGVYRATLLVKLLFLEDWKVNIEADSESDYIGLEGTFHCKRGVV